MPAYQVAMVKLASRTPGFMEYVKKSAEIIARYGAEYIIRGPAESVQEGDYLQGRSLVVSKWPSVETIKAFYDSPEYQAIKPLRDGSGVYDIGIFPEAPR